MKAKFMSKAEVIGASLRTEPHSAQSANSQHKPNDGFVEFYDIVFGDGKNLASLKLHYLTLGTPRRDGTGVIVNGVLLLHGTAGSADDFGQAAFFDAPYRAGEPLDLGRYFLVIPDANGAGDSSKPSDGLHTHFPHYGYKDQVADPITNLDEGASESETHLENHLHASLGSRVRHVRVVSQNDGIILQGSVCTFYAKQLAQHLIMQLTKLPILANEIEVC
jgi:homoserine O-acetyltransferase/O-succinyltransferase